MSHITPMTEPTGGFLSPNVIPTGGHSRSPIKHMEITFSALLSSQEIIVSSKIKKKIKNHIPCKPIGFKTRNTRWPIGVKTSAWRNTPVAKIKLERYYKVQHMHMCVCCL